MLRAVIVEDEQMSRTMLEDLLEENCRNLDVVASVGTSEEGFEAIALHHPDVVFLDIELKNESGFDLVERCQSSGLDFKVVFTTAHQQYDYALKAIEFSAINYLVKPVATKQLVETVSKIEKMMSKDHVNKSLDVLLRNIKTSNSEHQIALSTSDGLIFVRVSNIVYCESDGPYTTFFFKTKEAGMDKIITSRTLKEYEELLSGYDFFRIHKSYLINMKEMKKYIRGEGGQVILSNGVALDVAKRKKDSFLSSLSKL